MIDGELFAQHLGVLADRFGRALAGPTLREYHARLSAELSTEEFVAAARLVFRDETFWPAPRVFVEKVRPSADPALLAQAAFERVVTLVRRHGWQFIPPAILADLDRPTLRAVGTAGGWRAIAECDDSGWPFLRKRFEDAHRALAAERAKETAAQVALEEAEFAVQSLVAGVAGATGMPKGRLLRAPEDRAVPAAATGRVAAGEVEAT